MAITNRERVGKGLDLLSAGLRPFCRTRTEIPPGRQAGLTHHFFRAYAPLFPAFLRVYHGN